MKRLLAPLIAVVALSGCQSQGPPGADPFFGRTTVPPPSTGSISSGPIDPYYGRAPYSGFQNSAPPAAVTPQIPPTTGGQPSAPGGPNYAPPGGSYNYQGSTWSRMGASLAARSATRVAPPSLFDRARQPTPEATPTPVVRERVTQVLQPRAKAVEGSPDAWGPRPARASMAERPRPLHTPEESVEITDLPRRDRLTSTTRPRPASDGSGVRLAAGTERPGDSSGVTAAVGSSEATQDAGAAAEFAPRASYGYDPEYRWLRGKLEYSQIDRHWKLRYIPVDGATDQFGGSVVLPDPKVLSGCQRGDFIEVRGQLGQQNSKNSYAPTYEVAEVKRLAQASR